MNILHFQSRAAAMLFLILGAVGCASPKPLEIAGDESFAVIYTKPTNCVARGACVSKVSIKAINGDGVSNLSAKYNFRITPGDVSVIVLAYPVAGDRMKFTQGVCELKWAAVAGQVYILDRTIENDGFLITAQTKTGSEIAACLAPFGYE